VPGGTFTLRFRKETWSDTVRPYDNLDRTIEDAVTTVGSRVDDSVLRLEWAYEVRGMLQTATSYDAASSGSAVNQVQWAYNDFGQLTTSYQEHSGTVNTGTTPAVQYGYADGSANTIRPTSLTYPDSRSLTYSYGTAGGTDDKASRVAGIVESSTTLAGYAYLGLGSVVEVDYTQPNVQYDLIGSTPYAGLDRFNRIIDSRWKGASSDLDRIEYGYDRVGNRTYREVLTDSTNSFDELYSNDGLYRLDDLKRGQLNTGHTGMTSTDFEQFWSLDETGNWATFQQDDNGNGTWDLVQDRTSNKVNEITLIDNTTGDAWGSPAYDPAGNMVRLPNTQATGTGWNELTVDNWNDLTVDEWNDLNVTKEDEITYDAWNRLISITRSDGTQQVNGYDALRRRMTVETWSGGTLDETRHTWFSAGWQALEDRIDSSTSAERQNVWGLRYIDDLVLRDRDTNDDGTLNERPYALQDANWNVTSVCSTAGAIQERCAYQAYGTPLFLNASYASPQSTSSYVWTTLFAGYHYDTDTGLYHVRHRTYSPQLGTWMQRDPIGYHAADLNLLQYVVANPGVMVDPLGLAPPLRLDGSSDDVTACRVQSGTFLIKQKTRITNHGGLIGTAYSGPTTINFIPTHAPHCKSIDFIQVLRPTQYPSGRPFDPSLGVNVSARRTTGFPFWLVLLFCGRRWSSGGGGWL